MKKLTLILLAMFVITPPRYLQAWTGEPSGSIMTPSDYLAKGEASGGGMPAGTVAIWPSSTAIPEDWLECNGQYAGTTELYDATGSYYTPDYQGMFLRGVGGNSSGLGIEQGDAIRNITGHCITRVNSPEFVSGVFIRDVPTQTFAPGPYPYLGKTYFDASNVVPTANENRPVNKAVKYIIKIR